MLKVAVIILNWNGAKMLSQFLPSVVKYSNLPSVKVIVADNGSTDDSESIVCTQFPEVDWLDLKENHGFALGYNLAIEKVEAEYVILLNSDVEVTEGWLEPQIAYLDEHLDVAACQPKIRSWKDKTFFEYAGAAGGYIDYLGYPFCRGRVMDTLEKDNGQYDSVETVFWATGAALCVRREAYLEVGGLDPRFFAHMEEIDLCWRLWSRGYSLVVQPKSMVYHVGGATLSKSNPRKTYLNFRNNLLMIYKNADAATLHRIEQKRLLLDYIALVVYLLKGEVKNAKAVRKARSDYKKMKADFKVDRETNLALIKQKPKGVLNKSIVLQYYLKGKKLFSQLKGIN